MKRADIIDIISENTGLTKLEVDAVLKGFMETVSDSLKRGDHIELRGFGIFKVVERAQRIARNPKTNQEVIVPARKTPVFKVSKELRRAVEQKT